MLFDMTSGGLVAVSKTTFAAESVLERTHLQAAVRDNISVLREDLLVVAEEFGEFEDTHRRIDLLCVDHNARLIVVELKRTEDGGHMELQALRYAAMVSVMTFDQLAETFANHLKKLGAPEYDRDTARAQLIDWFEEVEDEEPVISREVGIILASADFSTEITTTVLWLNEFYSMDITCIRLSPYRHEGRLLLDVQQVIPLPEAEELTVRLKRREAAVREGRAFNPDLTKYVITTPQGETEPLAKRRAVLHLAQAVHASGVTCEELAEALPSGKFRRVSGDLEGDALWSAMVQTHGLPHAARKRWFSEEAFHDDGRTWVLGKNWGKTTEPVLKGLVKKAPGGYSFRAV